jgi:hypothetical protein
MARDDRTYLEQRAEAELDRAQQASHPAAVRAHYELLGHYLNRLYPGDPPDGPPSASGQAG